MIDQEIVKGQRPPHYRLPAGSHTGTVRLQVSDLERSTKFYQQTLGFRVSSSDGGIATLSPMGDDRVLIELNEVPGAAPVPSGGRLGLYHFAILLTDRAALGRFLRHSQMNGVKLGSADHVVSEALYLHDPDGLGIEVYADRPSDQWDWPDGELIMTADPLDMKSLVSAGGEDPWTGMPPGTVIGHVHLHVGDLEVASEFYHATLGFDKTHWSFPRALFLAAGGYHHHLGVNTWAPPLSPTDTDARLLEWELLLPNQHNVDEVAVALREAGHSLIPQSVGWTVADPWGTTLHVRPERS